jgi:hypothetical protein
MILTLSLVYRSQRLTTSIIGTQRTTGPTLTLVWFISNTVSIHMVEFPLL